jgi:hypothetical protein
MIAFVSVDATTEFIHWEMLDHLRKDGSALVHLPLPFWFAEGQGMAKRYNEFSNRFLKRRSLRFTFSASYGPTPEF